ncbi:hypothetical protein ACH5RR_036134 [Cinchona calisaya]|uniref:Uncharacterized protein n=1 Tax=Cinchona calisaya TaxID=153742 RepID=A0ABD2Y797_9GENT
MSTPPVLAKATGSCKDYKPQCIVHTQKALFYIALALIAVGISGHILSLVALFIDQFEKKQVDTKADKPKPRFKKYPSFANIMRRNQCGAQDCISNLSSAQPEVSLNQNRKKPDNDSAAEENLSKLQFQPVEAMLALVTQGKKKKYSELVF